MKRILTFIIALSAFIPITKAQLRIPASYGPSIAYGLEGTAVIGPANAYYNYGAGAVVKMELTVLRSFNFTASAGFQSIFLNSTYRYFLNEEGFSKANYNFIPVMVGGRYYIGDTWYAEGEVGGVLYTRDYSKPAKAFAVGTGFSLPIDGGHAFDIGVRFQNWSRPSVPNEVSIDHMVSLRLAYKIGI